MKFFIVTSALFFGLLSSCGKAKTDPKEQQQSKCKQMILDSSKRIHSDENTKILEYKILSHTSKGKVSLVFVEAYVDFAGRNNFRGRWACIFKGTSTDGFLKLAAFLNKGQWTPASK